MTDLIPPGRGPCHGATPCDAVPPGSVALVLAFENLGTDAEGDIIPGGANAAIAARIEACGSRLSLVLTQKAISVALAKLRPPQSGTPVAQMHRHDRRTTVRTFAALQGALWRFESIPEQLVLCAHPGQLRRARMILRSLYAGRILTFHPGRIGFEDDRWSRPWWWRVKNGGAWIADPLLAASNRWRIFRVFLPLLARFDAVPVCPPRLGLGKLHREGNTWTGFEHDED